MLVLLGGRFGEAATLTLAWDPPSDGIITGYVIRYGTQSRTYTDQINVGVTTTFSVDDLTPGIRYYFTIQARGSAGSLSEPSNEASAVAPAAGGTRPPQRPPGPTMPPFETSPPPNEAFGVRARLDGKLPDIPPVDPSTSTNIAALAASVRDHRFIDLRWTAEVGTDLFGYRISTGSAPGREDVGTFTTGPTAQFTIGDLPAGNYYVRVQALEVSGTGGSSPEVFVKFDPSSTAPDATRSLEAKVGGNTVALSWLPPGDGLPVDRYVIEVGSAPGAADVMVFETRQLAFATRALPNGTSHVRVKAVRGDVAQSASNGGAAVIVGAGVLAQCQTSPAAPTLIRGAVTGTGIEVSWAPTRGEKPTSYILHVGSSPEARDVAVLNLSADTTSYSMPVSRGRVFARVTALNDCGASDPSREVSVSAGIGPLTRPGPPVGIDRQTSPTTVVLTWSPPVTGEAPDQYIIEMTRRDGARIGTFETGSTATFFHYSAPSVVHLVRVRAANAAGIGPAAPPLTVVVPRY